jgi:predicted Fe-Mo cluster-binding NifX family protein
MKQVIAIPLEEGRLCQHFGHCQQFAIIEAEEGTMYAVRIAIALAMTS